MYEYYADEELMIVKLLNDNCQADHAIELSVAAEALNFFKFSAAMLSAFPVGLYMRKRIRKNKRLNHILQFNELLSVRNNIEKGSFAYDTILFKLSPFQLLQNKSHLANLVCLAILFGDEFIDGVAATYGKKNIQALCSNDTVDFYLHFRSTEKGHELFYAFDMCTMLPEEVLQSINPKYGITYKAFYDHLQFLLQEMNVYLNKTEETKRDEVATLICKACNKCFDTYKADINEFTGEYSLNELLNYQKTKDDDIIQVLLTLRAVLLNKKQLEFQKDFTSWSSMVRSMQLYDDMQDVAGDCDFQMNVICYFAKNYFTEEWIWLQQNKVSLQNIAGLELHCKISLYMPASCMLTQQYARNIAHTKLSWVQKKIQNYLWRKNWLGLGNTLINSTDFNLETLMNKKNTSAPLQLFFIKQTILATENIFITREMKLAHILDIALLDPALKIFIFKKLTKKEKYFLMSCYLEFPLHKKAAIAEKILNGI